MQSEAQYDPVSPDGQLTHRSGSERCCCLTKDQHQEFANGCYQASWSCLRLLISVSILALLVLDHDVTKHSIWLLPFYFTLGTWVLRLQLRVRNVVLMVLLVFTTEMLLLRGYVVQCRHRWEMQAADFLSTMASNTTIVEAESQHDVAITTPQPMTKKGVTEEFLANYCDPNFMPKQLKPTMYLAEAFSIDAAARREAENEEGFVWDRARCHRWTCTYTHQSDGYVFRLLTYLIAPLLLNILWTVPRHFLKAICLPCDLFCSCKELKDNFSHCAGRCYPSMIWWWICWLTCWMIWFITWVPNFNYGDILPKIAKAGSSAVMDFTAILVCTVTISIVFLLYVNRRHIRGLAGIENVNVFRWQFHDLLDPEWRHDDRVIQVCLWKVSALKTDQLEIATKILNRSMFSTSTTETAGVQSEERLKKDSKIDLFVRIECGDNQFQQTRVHNGILLNDNNKEVLLQETVKINLEQIGAELLVSICDQKIVGHAELGRVVIDKETLCHYIRDETKSLAWSWLGGDEGQDASRNRLNVQQITRMFAKKLSTQLQSRKEDEDEMMEAGFEAFPLNKGGVLWMAFAELERENA